MGITLWKQLTEVIGKRQAFFKVVIPICKSCYFRMQFETPISADYEVGLR